MSLISQISPGCFSLQSILLSIIIRSASKCPRDARQGGDLFHLVAMKREAYEVKLQPSLWICLCALHQASHKPCVPLRYSTSWCRLFVFVFIHCCIYSACTILAHILNHNILLSPCILVQWSWSRSTIASHACCIQCPAVLCHGSQQSLVMDSEVTPAGGQIPEK